MGPHDDDLTSWQDDPVVRALTGRGSPDELAGEAEALAAFRAAVPVRSRRRYAGRLGRLGVGGSALGVTLALSGGVAAAYSGSLPSPVQRAMSHWPVLEIPAPSHHKSNSNAGGQQPAAGTTSTPAPTSTPTHAALPVASPSASGRPKPTPSRRSAKPAVKPRPTTSPTVTPPAVTTPTPTPTPTPTVTATASPMSITISVSDTTVPVGGTVTAYGHLATSTGEPVSGQQVWLLERTAGQEGVSQVASGTTGADGSVQLASPALAHSARLRLVTDSKVRSAAIAVIVTPTITPTVTQEGTSDSIHLSTNADPGDTIMLQIRSGGSWQEFASNQLDGSGGATFGVTAPTKHPEHFRAILPRTRGHGFATVRFTVPPG